jgi:hypothetical protein
MLFRNLNFEKKAQNISEGNFISADFLGIIDSDAKSKLAFLTIDKMFEGLDLKKSAELHDFIEAYAPSLKAQSNTSTTSSINDVIGLGNSKKSVLEIINSQLHYMQLRLEGIEKELDKFYKDIEMEYTKTISKEELEGSISGFTGPANISSIVPTINSLVADAIRTGLVKFDNPSTKQAFLTLHKLKISDYIFALKTNIYNDAKNISLLPLYRKIDSLDLEEITTDNASLSEIKSYVFNPVDLSSMYKSFDPIARISAFLEESLMQYEYGIDVRKIFGANYTQNFDDSEVLPIGVLRKFVKTIDISVFEPMKELLYDVAVTLIGRAYAQNPDEDDKNIFVPSLQFMYISMLSLLAFKLINYNLQIQTASIKREERIKAEQQAVVVGDKKMRATKLFDTYKQLNALNFFKKGGLVYKKESNRMLPEIVKLINNFFVYAGDLDKSKLDSPTFDDMTYQAVLKFQTEGNLYYKDGKIGNETRGFMKIYSEDLANAHSLV